MKVYAFIALWFAITSLFYTWVQSDISTALFHLAATSFFTILAILTKGK